MNWRTLPSATRPIRMLAEMRYGARSLDCLVGAQQQFLRNGQAEGFGGFQVYYELEPHEGTR